MRITKEYKNACKMIKSRPEWKYIEEILITYLNKLKDLSTLDENEKKEDKNIVVAGRLKAYEYLNKFLYVVNLLSQESKKIDERDQFV